MNPDSDLTPTLDEIAEGNLSVPDRNYVLSRTFWSDRIAVRTDRWKYVATLSEDGRDVDSAEVFDLETDPDEQNPLEDAAFAEVGEAIVRRRLAHEREMEAIRRAAESV